MDQQQNNAMTLAFATAIISFALFVFGIKIVLGANIDMSNILAYIVASLVFGTIAGILGRFRYRSGLWIYLLGLAFGFFQMINTFSRDLDGWADLTGIISLFFIAGIGLAIAIVVLLIQYFVNRDR